MFMIFRTNKTVTSKKKNIMGKDMKWIHLKRLRFIRGGNSEYMNVNDKNMLWESINIPKKYYKQHPVLLAKK